jgi:hypothetical protein
VRSPVSGPPDVGVILVKLELPMEGDEYVGVLGDVETVDARLRLSRGNDEVGCCCRLAMVSRRGTH